MKISYCEQLSPEWWALKTGRIGGKRFGQVISTRKNRLIYDLLNEQLSGFIEMDDYESEDMLFGVENEPIAAQLYSDQSGIQFDQIGAIISESSDIHIASPDRINLDLGIVLEIKCTQNGAIHLQRFFEGPESSYMGQIINYFTVSDEVKEVHWVSYCPSLAMKPLVIYRFTPDQFEKEIRMGRDRIGAIELELKEMKSKVIF